MLQESPPVGVDTMHSSTVRRSVAGNIGCGYSFLNPGKESREGPNTGMYCGNQELAVCHPIEEDCSTMTALYMAKKGWNAQRIN